MNRKILLSLRTIFAILIVTLSACSSRKIDAKGYFLIKSAAEFMLLSEHPHVQLVDVRTAQEYNSGHMPGALLIPITDPDFEKQVYVSLNFDKAVAVYCRSGKRSQEAVKRLKALGFKTIYELKGGYLVYEEYLNSFK